MTTEDTNSTEVNSTTRSISELLALECYEGLTDSEVRLLINYECQMALANESTNVMRNSNQAKLEAAQELAAACCASTTEVLNSIIASTTNYEGVSPTAVTNLLSSLEEV